MKPRVARNELPWVNGTEQSPTPTGLRHVRRTRTQPLSGLEPDAPGLGLKLNREVVAKYTHGERLFD